VQASNQPGQRNRVRRRVVVAGEQNVFDGDIPSLLRRIFLQRSDQLIERMKSGQKVDPAELDKALTPATEWARTRCPACKTRLITWYIVAAIIIVGACWGGLLILEKVN